MTRTCCILAMLFFAAVASAQTPQPTGPAAIGKLADRFNRADTNHDGTIDKDEARIAKLWAEDDFASLDADRNGGVTMFELGQVLEQQVRHWMSDFDAADTNHDGTLSEEEIKQAPKISSMLTPMRAPQSGVSRAEFESSSLNRIYRQGDLPSVAPNLIDKRF